MPPARSRTSGKAALEEETLGGPATPSGPTVDQDRPLPGDLVQTGLQLTLRNEDGAQRLQVADLPLEGLANVQKERLRLSLEDLQQALGLYSGRLFGLRHPAEHLVVDQSRLSRMVAADRAARIPANLQFTP